MENKQKATMEIPREKHEIDKKEISELILPKLKGKVFHVTNEVGLNGIIADELIKNNKDNKYAYTFGQSKNSYGRLRGYTCLVDLRSVSEEKLNDALCCYYFLDPSHENDRNFFLIIDQKLHEKLIPWHKAKQEKPFSEMWVPYIEAWYPGDIRSKFINKIIEIKIYRDPNSDAEILRKVSKKQRQLKK